ncbi:pyrimidine/purine nucleoside phosphorylase [Jiulongibacter sp. NS-SX5]|uniref:pyrimidine/purine nucleoside phosphorylase n=1 Tax=Jiulongibacter sp. NS-SX5 TaxID=3463854 RepID=UPI004059D354
MINVNEYFDGNVKSIGYENAEGKSSVGVMEPGEYTFGTGKPEIMTVVEGEMTVKLPGESEWKTFKTGEYYNVPGNSSFDLKIPVQTAYLCQYR